jgi:adenosylcobinamide kinase/adenosylcobinamide-phosphate guanylyltransferase
VIELVLGGARSGKSAYAEAQIGDDLNLRVLYVATAQQYTVDEQGDQEMQDRICAHQKSRPNHWDTLEEPLALSDVLTQNETKYDYLLIDCLTLWLSNCLCSEDTAIFERQKSAFLNSLSSFNGKVYLVSNEVGQGIIPMNKLSRRFVDEAGRLHQDIAKIANHVTWVVAGLPQTLK